MSTCMPMLVGTTQSRHANILCNVIDMVSYPHIYIWRQHIVYCYLVAYEYIALGLHMSRDMYKIKTCNFYLFQRVGHIRHTDNRSFYNHTPPFFETKLSQTHPSINVSCLWVSVIKWWCAVFTFLLSFFEWFQICVNQKQIIICNVHGVSTRLVFQQRNDINDKFVYYYHGFIVALHKCSILLEISYSLSITWNFWIYFTG